MNIDLENHVNVPLFRSMQWSRHLVADIEEVETMVASEIHDRRLNVEEIIKLWRGEHFIFPTPYGTAKLSVIMESVKPL